MYDEKYNDYLEMIDAADEAMYQSKTDGRNRVTLLSKDLPPKDLSPTDV